MLEGNELEWNGKQAITRGNRDDYILHKHEWQASSPWSTIEDVRLKARKASD